MHGTGSMAWPDGRSYKGGFVDDRKSGEGTFTWADGRSYDGQWEKGRQHGVGVFVDTKSRCGRDLLRSYLGSRSACDI